MWTLSSSFCSSSFKTLRDTLSRPHSSAEMSKHTHTHKQTNKLTHVPKVAITGGRPEASGKHLTHTTPHSASESHLCRARSTHTWSSSDLTSQTFSTSYRNQVINTILRTTTTTIRCILSHLYLMHTSISLSYSHFRTQTIFAVYYYTYFNTTKHSDAFTCVLCTSVSIVYISVCSDGESVYVTVKELSALESVVQGAQGKCAPQPLVELVSLPAEIPASGYSEVCVCVC